MSAFPNDAATVDLDRYTVSRTVSIQAPLEKVWAAITEAKHLARWLPQRVNLPVAEVGAHGAFFFEGYGDVPVEVEEIEPMRMIAYRWGNEPGAAVTLDAATSTVFRFTIETIEGGTQLTVVETGFETIADPAVPMEQHRGGWTSELDELVAYLEGSA
jgi:uncharacterized protein YndB with AHSA1/START domain